MLAVSAADGEMKICPRCYAVLWQPTTEAMEAKAAAAVIARAARAEIERHKRAERKAREAARKAQEGTPK
jgi:type II secretory pathway component PulM